MLSVLVGIRLGHVHDGFMVNVIADNAKLNDRATRIVAALSGQDMAAAQKALAATGGRGQTCGPCRPRPDGGCRPRRA